MGPDDWINTSLRPRFLVFDIGACIVLPIAFLHPRMWTIQLVITSFVFFFFLERRGLLPMTLLQILRLRVGNFFRWPAYITRRRYYRRRMESK